MAHNSAHYSLVNVGVGFMQCYDRTRVNPRPSPCVCVHSIMITTNQFHLVKWPAECPGVIYWWSAIKGRHGSLLARVFSYVFALQRVIGP